MHQFVSHWVTEIHQFTPTATWKCCPTEENPTDLLRRGITVAVILTLASGITMLTDHNKWPVWQPAAMLHLQAAAAVTTSEFVPATSLPPCNGLQKIITIVPLTKVVKVTAIVLWFVDSLKLKDCRKNGPLTAVKLHVAKRKWVKDCQQQLYCKELTNMCHKQTTAKRLPLVRHLH